MTYYKVVAENHDGSHKIAKVTRDVMASLIFGFRCLQEGVQTRRYKEIAESVGLSWLSVHKMLFINLYTGERLEVA